MSKSHNRSEVCGEFFLFDDILLMCTTKLLSEYCFPMSSKAITALVKTCCDVLACSFERDDLEQVNVLKSQSEVESEREREKVEN